MNILFIAYTDMSKRNGGSICTKSFIDIFCSISQKFALVLAKSEKYAWDFPNITLYEVESTKKINRFKNILTGATNRYLPYLQNNKNIFNDINLVVLSSGVLGYGIPNLLDELGIPFITIHHNYEPIYHHDNKTMVSLFGLFTYNIFKAEDNALKKSMLNIALTPKDAGLLMKKHRIYNKKRIIVSPGIVDSEFKCPNIPQKISNKVVISGALHDYQTIDGILYYLKELNNIVLRHIPDIKVIIAGRNPTKSLKNKISKFGNIIMIENPINMDTIIEDALFYINPTRLGSGLKLRNIDALKYGCPIIAHENSCCGYEPLVGNGLYKFADKNTFEEALIRLKRQSISRHAIQREFLKFYSFQNIRQQIVNYLNNEKDFLYRSTII